MYVQHLMLLLKLLLDAAIPDTPHWVAQERAKMEHRRRLVERKADAHLRYNVSITTNWFMIKRSSHITLKKK